VCEPLSIGGEIKLFLFHHHYLLSESAKKKFGFFISCRRDLLFLLSDFGVDAGLGSVGFRWFDKI